ncbi:MAG TPA: hypothetical protein DD477_01145 [Spirochaetaceae bacterium]|nr:hypothetical protein [Spirochaetaceae bacterium]HAW84739.1 hypothetical protein [Spirochaetaceae bacterium]HAX36443.1 hypothetical protein [Spirochaetaceae bacterium]HBO39811.1 hypothetical protein [Spirochaetaceae bacterium]HCQ85937.1 hypothetical protein [Spirochaetaceae bacterium]
MPPPAAAHPPSRVASRQRRRGADPSSGERGVSSRAAWFKLHQLTSDRAATWAAEVNANWRITFYFEKGDAYVVNLGQNPKPDRLLGATRDQAKTYPSGRRVA